MVHLAKVTVSKPQLDTMFQTKVLLVRLNVLQDISRISQVNHPVTLQILDISYLITPLGSKLDVLMEHTNLISGQASCLDASPGHYVPGFASPTQTECALGSYQPQSGETSCISASIGYYVDQSASTNQTSCPPGTSTTSTGSVSINDCYTDTDF